MELIEGRDYFVRYVPFPTSKCHGMTLMDLAGFFSIYIDSNASPLEQRAALYHELAHIELNHFYSDEPIMLKEQEANNIIRL